MVSKILFWGGFGIAVRLWALGIEMRPLFRRQEMFIYPIYAGIGGAFGYWLQGVERRQDSLMADRRDRLIEKRKRHAERLAQAGNETAAAH